MLSTRLPRAGCGCSSHSIANRKEKRGSKQKPGMQLENKATGTEMMRKHKRTRKTTIWWDRFALHQIFPAGPQERGSLSIWMLLLQGPSLPDAKTSRKGSSSWCNPAPLSTAHVQPSKQTLVAAKKSWRAEGNERRHLSSSVPHLIAHHFLLHHVPAMPRCIRLSHRGMSSNAGA